MAKEKKEKKTKGSRKTLFIVLGIILAIGILGSSSEEETAETKDATPTPEITATTDKQEENDATDSQQTEKPQQKTDADNLIIELIAGEKGQYGELITMSEGTDMEESFYVYYVPAGTYNVTNVGEYMTQISVYEGFANDEETGYDEYTNTGDIVMLDVGKAGTVEIPDGWFIEIQEPARISLTLAE